MTLEKFIKEALNESTIRKPEIGAHAETMMGDEVEIIGIEVNYSKFKQFIKKYDTSGADVDDILDMVSRSDTLVAVKNDDGDIFVEPWGADEGTYYAD